MSLASKRLVAYYTARGSCSENAEELRSHLEALLPPYMVPAAYVQLASTPLTQTGSWIARHCRRLRAMRIAIGSTRRHRES